MAEGQGGGKWFSLPNELSLKILGYLPQDEVCKCMLVCRRWYELCNDSSLWKNLEVSCLRVSQGQLSKLARRWPMVKEMSFHGTGSDSSERVAFRLDATTWSMFPHLECVGFSACHRALVTSHALQALVLSCPRLRRLRCMFMEHFTSRHLVAVLEPSQRYVELSFAGCKNIDDAASAYLGTSGEFMRKIKILDLGGLLYLSDDCVIRILGNCPVLKSLALDGEDLSDKVPKLIGSQLQELESLSIMYCDGLTDASLHHLSTLKSLKNLYLHKGGSFTNDGFESLFEALAVSTTDPPLRRGLERVSLTSCNGLRDTGLIKLTESCPHLKELDLTWCWDLTDAGLEAVVVNCKEISSLVLVGLKAAHCTPIITTPHLPKLLTLDLTQVNDVDDDLLRVMKSCRPWVTITDYYGEVVLES